MVKTKGDVSHCPYCGGENLQGTWTRTRPVTYLHHCEDCDELFEVDNKWNPDRRDGLRKP